MGFDAPGNLWAGTENGEIHRYDGEIWMRVADAGELDIGRPRLFCKENATGMWVVGSSGGLARYTNGRWTYFGKSAFDDRSVVDLDVSPSGIPVLATDNGIWGYDPLQGWKPVSFGALCWSGEKNAATARSG